MDKAATIRNAIPASHVLPVKNQTMNATMAAGTSMKSRRIIRIINNPIMIRPISPKISAINSFFPLLDKSLCNEYKNICIILKNGDN